MRWLILLALGATSCAHSTPPNDPGDVFAGRIFNCRSQVVAIERDSAWVDVAVCLRNIGPAGCLRKQTQYDPASVACAVRDLGASANVSVLQGDTDPIVRTISDAARNWIQSEGMGFQ